MTFCKQRLNVLILLGLSFLCVPQLAADNLSKRTQRLWKELAILEKSGNPTSMIAGYTRIVTEAMTSSIVLMSLEECKKIYEHVSYDLEEIECESAYDAALHGEALASARMLLEKAIEQNKENISVRRRQRLVLGFVGVALLLWPFIDMYMSLPQKEQHQKQQHRPERQHLRPRVFQPGSYRLEVGKVADAEQITGVGVKSLDAAESVIACAINDNVLRISPAFAQHIPILESQKNFTHQTDSSLQFPDFIATRKQFELLAAFLKKWSGSSSSQRDSLLEDITEDDAVALVRCFDYFQQKEMFFYAVRSYVKAHKKTCSICSSGKKDIRKFCDGLFDIIPCDAEGRIASNDPLFTLIRKQYTFLHECDVLPKEYETMNEEMYPSYATSIIELFGWNVFKSKEVRVDVNNTSLMGSEEDLQQRQACIVELTEYFDGRDESLREEDKRLGDAIRDIRTYKRVHVQKGIKLRFATYITKLNLIGLLQVPSIRLVQELSLKYIGSAFYNNDLFKSLELPLDNIRVLQVNCRDSGVFTLNPTLLQLLPNLGCLVIKAKGRKISKKAFSVSLPNIHFMKLNLSGVINLPASLFCKMPNMRSLRLFLKTASRAVTFNKDLFAGLANLQNLSIEIEGGDTGVTRLPQGWGQHLPKLKSLVLDFDDAFGVEVTPGWFSDMQNVKSLILCIGGRSLRGQLAASLADGCFQECNQMRTLEVSLPFACCVGRDVAKMFAGLNQLEDFTLMLKATVHDKNIQELQKTIKTQLKDILPEGCTIEVEVELIE